MRTVAKMTPSFEEVQETMNRRTKYAGILVGILGLIGTLAGFIRF